MKKQVFVPIREVLDVDLSALDPETREQMEALKSEAEAMFRSINEQLRACDERRSVCVELLASLELEAARDEAAQRAIRRLRTQHPSKKQRRSRQTRPLH